MKTSITNAAVTVSRGGFQVHSLRDDTGTVNHIPVDVVFITLNGKDYYLPNGYKVTVTDDDGHYDTLRKQYDPGEMAEKVRVRGYINLEHWIEVPRVGLETLFNEEAEREQFERAGFGNAGW